MQRVDPWKAGDRDSAEHRNQLVRAVQELQTATGGGILNVGGPPRARIIEEQWAGVVTDKGPANEANFTDARYWVVRAYVPAALTRDKISPAGLVPTEDSVVVATNFGELLAGTHTLAKNTPVWVHAIYDGRDPNPSKHYVFTAGSGGSIAAHNQGVVVAAAPTFINIPTTMAGALEFVVNGSGVDLRIKAGQLYQVLQTTAAGTTVGMDWVRGR